MELTDDEIKAIKKLQGTGTLEEEWLKRPMYPSEWELIFGEPPKEHKVREKGEWIVKTFKIKIATETEEEMQKEQEWLEMNYGAEEQKPGRWEYLQYDANPRVGNWHCSECHNVLIEYGTKQMPPLYTHCPYCGTRMIFEEENE